MLQTCYGFISLFVSCRVVTPLKMIRTRKRKCAPAAAGVKETNRNLHPGMTMHVLWSTWLQEAHYPHV